MKSLKWQIGAAIMSTLCGLVFLFLGWLLKCDVVNGVAFGFIMSGWITVLDHKYGKEL